MDSDIGNTHSDRASPRVKRFYPDAGFCLLATAVFIFLNGLPVGAGNQSLHLAWLRHLRNPELFANDPLIESFQHFPSLFFHLLARIIPAGVDPALALQTLQILNTFLLLLGLIRLTRTLFPGSITAPGIVLLLIGSSSPALAETPLPPVSFSHTAFGLMLSVFALDQLFKRRLEIAFILMGIIASFHLLTAAYTGAIAGIFLLLTWKERPFTTLLIPGLLSLIMASPVLYMLISHSSADYDAAWLQLLFERSAHHVLPGTWWRTGDPAVGRFMITLGWLVLSLAWLPDRSKKACVRALWVAPVILLLTGLIGAFGFQHPLLLRAQLFRASMYLRILSIATLAASVHPAWRSARFPGRMFIGIVCAGLILPELQSFQLWLLLCVAGWTWWHAKLRTPHALLLIPVFFTLTLSDILLETRFWTPQWVPLEALTALGLLTASTLFCMAFASTTRPFKLASATAATILCLLTLQTHKVENSAFDSWQDIQSLTRIHTPVNARILTPVKRSGFRDHSYRSIAGEWRDGTMQFFDPAFAEAWHERMEALSVDTASRSNPDTWVSLGNDLNAEYAVLPVGSVEGLVQVADNEQWMLVKTQRPPPPPLPDPPENAVNPEDWLKQERFMVEVVRPNIEKNRQSTLTLTLTDSTGERLSGLPVEIEQTRLAFGIGSALHHFEEVQQPEKGFKAPRVHPKELEHFTKLFNYSVIGFSGKWTFTEPEMGKEYYADLDAYVEWCTQNNVEIEFHFVTGYEPGWMAKKPGPFREAALMNRVHSLIERYGDRISNWQIINEQRMQSEAPAVFRLFREKLPDAVLGVSHCARFFTNRTGNRGEQDLKRGWRSMVQIQKAGETVDFFAVHAHRPFGTWWDPRTIYRVLDEYQEEGVRVHISETGISHAGKIEGGILSGNWTPELQADYLVRFFEIAYSHPNVDVVNFWGFGPRTWQKHIGLLDEHYNPLPAYHALHQLVNETWKSSFEGRSNSKGDITFTGHHGDYAVKVRHPDGRVGTAAFSLSKHSTNPLPVTVVWEAE